MMSTCLTSSAKDSCRNCTVRDCQAQATAFLDYQSEIGSTREWCVLPTTVPLLIPAQGHLRLPTALARLLILHDPPRGALPDPRHRLSGRAVPNMLLQLPLPLPHRQNAPAALPRAKPRVYPAPHVRAVHVLDGSPRTHAVRRVRAACRAACLGG
jgi:hypothetical protein